MRQRFGLSREVSVSSIYEATGLGDQAREPAVESSAKPGNAGLPVWGAFERGLVSFCSKKLHRRLRAEGNEKNEECSGNGRDFPFDLKTATTMRCGSGHVVLPDFSRNRHEDTEESSASNCPPVPCYGCVTESSPHSVGTIGANY